MTTRDTVLRVALEFRGSQKTKMITAEQAHYVMGTLESARSLAFHLATLLGYVSLKRVPGEYDAEQAAEALERYEAEANKHF